MRGGKRPLKTKLTQGDHQAQVYSDQVVRVVARRENGPCEKWPIMLKEELETTLGSQGT